MILSGLMRLWKWGQVGNNERQWYQLCFHNLQSWQENSACPLVENHDRKRYQLKDKNHEREKKKNSQKRGSKYKIHVQLTLVDRIINKYSPNKRWIVMDIAAKQWGEYPPLSMALRWIIILVYATQIQKNWFQSFLSIYQKKGLEMKLLAHKFVSSLAAPRK